MVSDEELEEWRKDATDVSINSCCVLAGQEGHGPGEHRAYYDERIIRLIDELQIMIDVSDELRELWKAALKRESLLISEAAELNAHMETWDREEGFIDTNVLSTDLVRKGWPSPTIYREHEIIHILCNLIDKLREEKK